MLLILSPLYYNKKTNGVRISPPSALGLPLPHAVQHAVQQYMYMHTALLLLFYPCMVSGGDWVVKVNNITVGVSDSSLGPYWLKALSPSKNSPPTHTSPGYTGALTSQG